MAEILTLNCMTAAIGRTSTARVFLYQQAVRSPFQLLVIKEMRQEVEELGQNHLLSQAKKS